jgi:hypothetical protein
VGTSRAISSRKRATTVEPKGALGSSVPGTRDPKGSTPSVTKVLVPRMPGIAGDRTLVLAMPVKALSPARGKSVGGVSEGPTRRIRSAEKSDGRTPDAGATVEGIPVRGMALTFAGQRRNADLGSVRRRERVSSPLGDAPTTADVQRALRKGTTSACTLRSACTGRENTEMWLSRLGR